MNITIDELMTPHVLVAYPEQTLGEVRNEMLSKGFHAVPIVDNDHHPIGIVTSTDLLSDIVSDDMRLSQFPTPKVFTVPRYDGPHIAARVMRNHQLHHLIVTEEKKVVGIISSYDLLRLVEEHRFVMKQPPTPSKRRKSKIS